LPLVGLVIVIRVVEGLMDVSDDVEEISGHEGAFEGEGIFVGGEDGFAPVDGVDGVYVALEFVHTHEGVFWVVDAGSGGGYMFVK
jgi:hypothetical protein